MIITTNLTELHEALTKSRNDLLIELYIDEHGQCTGMYIGDTPRGGIINIVVAAEYEHLNNYYVEINHNYTGEYEFKNINYKHLVYLLIQEDIIKTQK